MKLISRDVIPLFIILAAAAMFHTASCSRALAEDLQCNPANSLIVSTPTIEQTSQGIEAYNKAIASMPVGPTTVLLGDSIANGWAARSGVDFKGETVWNYGVPSDRIQYVLWRLQNPALTKISPKKVLLILGTNNISDLKMDSCSVSYGLTDVIKKINQIWPSTNVYLFSILPRGADFKEIDNKRVALNKELRGIPKLFRNVRFVDVDDNDFTCGQYALGRLPTDTMTCSPGAAFQCNNYQPDHLHPNFTGYAKLRQYLEMSDFFSL